MLVIDERRLSLTILHSDIPSVVEYDTGAVKLSRPGLRGTLGPHVGTQSSPFLESLFISWSPSDWSRLRLHTGKRGQGCQPAGTRIVGVSKIDPE